jgi:hypothetical protein
MESSQLRPSPPVVTHYNRERNRALAGILSPRRSRRIARVAAAAHVSSISVGRGAVQPGEVTPLRHVASGL